MENQVINKIIDKLFIDHKIIAKWDPWFWKENDGELELTFGEIKKIFRVTFKREIKKHNLANIYQINDEYKDLIFIGDIIYPEIRKAMKEKNINYIDGACNTHIRTKDIYVYVDQKQNEIKREDYYKGRLFGNAGLKIIFTLLIDDTLINAPYRDIAEYTDTALGTVNYVMDQLKINGYIIFLNNQTLKLTNQKRLMERWITRYEEKFKKNLLLGKFKFRNDNWRELVFNDKETLWGGEPAAEILTHHLIPNNFTIYTKEERVELIKRYLLIPDEDGNVIVFKKFWNFDTKDFKKTVPPLLVYADLIETTDPRNIETAKIIYEKYLQNKFE